MLGWAKKRKAISGKCSQAKGQCARRCGNIHDLANIVRQITSLHKACTIKLSFKPNFIVINMLNCIEICAGAGGQALGLERAGFEPLALVEIDSACCATLRYNRPHWNVLEMDVRQFDGCGFGAVDLLAGGVPCPPFSKAGKQLGAEDERDLFGEALRLVATIRPKAVMLENVRGFLDAVFEDYRQNLKQQLEDLGYVCQWRLLNASDFGVSQLRPRVVIVAMQPQYAVHFSWPEVLGFNPPTVGELLLPMMAANGWKGAKASGKKKFFPQSIRTSTCVTVFS